MEKNRSVVSGRKREDQGSGKTHCKGRKEEEEERWQGLLISSR